MADSQTWKFVVVKQQEGPLATGTLKSIGPDIWKLRLQYHTADDALKRRIRRYLRMLIDDYTACLLYAIFTFMGCTVQCRLLNNKWTLSVTIPEHVFVRLMDTISHLRWHGVLRLKSSLEPLISVPYKLRDQLVEPRWNFQSGIKYVALENGRLITRREKSPINTLLSLWFKPQIRSIRFTRTRHGWQCRINGQTYKSRFLVSVQRWVQCQIFGLMFTEDENVHRSG